MLTSKCRILGLCLALALLASATGCLSTQKVAASVSGKIPRGSRVVITIPKDGAYEDEPYPGSGRKAAFILSAELQRFFPNTAVGKSTAGAYVVEPVLVHWEDRATEWSSIPDRIKVSLKVTDPRGQVVDARVLDSKSSYWTLGGDHPEKLLSKMAGAYARSLAGAGPASR